MTSPATEDVITRYLKERGIASDTSEVRVQALTGGVSCDVFAVTGADLDVVVKRALPQLRTAQEWHADTARVHTEGQALQAVVGIEPRTVPVVVDLGDEYLVMQRAPQEWVPWKTRLLGGQIDPAVAARLGEFLGQVQRASVSGAIDGGPFADRQVFRQLRAIPFHEQVSVVHPELRDAVRTTIAMMAEPSGCLVHGDYTPKNILTGPWAADTWVIDWEVAHLGDPTFDPAWVVGHLLLKGLRDATAVTALHQAATAFLAARAGVAGAPELDTAQLLRQIGVLLVARVDGRSPVDYLTASRSVAARELGCRILLDQPDSIDQPWKDIS